MSDATDPARDDLAALVHEATGSLLSRWRREIEAGESRVGWKIGLNDPAMQKSYGLDASLVGYLLESAVCEPGRPCDPGSVAVVALEPEIAIAVSADVAADASDAAIRSAIAGFASAIEVIGLDPPMGGVEEILAGNIFNCGVLFGETRSDVLLDGLEVSVRCDGVVSRSARVIDALGDPVSVVRHVADTLSRHGERLQAGDRIIGGSLTPPLPVVAGQKVVADFGALGSLSVTTPAGSGVSVECSG